jgi:hypothetical protein
MADEAFVQETQARIRRWSGVECPNAAAVHGLSDFPPLLSELEALRHTMVFEDEPSSFDAALQAEKEQQS